MNTQKGFISIGILLAIILGVVVIGGGAYYIGHQSAAPQAPVNTALDETAKPNSEANSTKVYRNAKYGFEVTYPNGWEVVTNPYPDQSEYIVLFNPFPGAHRNVVEPKIWIWKSVPKYGPVTTIDELKKALAAYYASDVPKLDTSIVEKGGFTFLQVNNLPGLVGELSAFTLIPQGVLGIYGSDSIIDRIQKI